MQARKTSITVKTMNEEVKNCWKSRSGDWESRNGMGEITLYLHTGRPHCEQ